MRADMLSWNRVEPYVRSDDQSAAVSRGLEARVHDPLWLLGRQWQFREFEGDDGGSPVAVRARFSTSTLGHWTPGISGGTGLPFDSSTKPLEMLVEQESRPAVGLRESAEAGLHFFTLLDAANKSAFKSDYLKQYPLQAPLEAAAVDPAANVLIQLLVGRAPDGIKLAADFKTSLAQGAAALPAQPASAAGDPAVLQIARSWLAWYESEVAVANSSDTWVPDRLEYQFSVAASAPAGTGEAVLAAPEYGGDGLDWYDFVHHANQSLGGSNPAPTQSSWFGLPAPVTFRGMPAQRWWEFEDAAVDLGAVDTAPEDLGRLLLTEFATVFGNDWYLIPLELPLGTLTSVTSLVVTDTFGEKRLIEPTSSAQAGGGPWRMFQLSESTTSRGAGGVLDALFLPPVVATTLDGRPLEEVLFLRDEMADQAWGVERIVQGASGGPVDRAEQWQRLLSANPLTPPAAPIAPLQYQLATTVPDYWIPLVPVNDGTSRGIRLERGAMLHFDSTTATPIEPRGRLLTAASPLLLYDEEVPRDGRRVRRLPVICRWTGGETLSWITRSSRVGRGEGSSGLRYDLANPT